jgi:rfaE bifunctional protein nucleotidyltransferase chain/domain
MAPNDRLLDALHEVKWYQDGTLALRRSCAHGICGSDAMMINGRNALACKVLVKDVAPKVTVEPIRGLPVLKDLIVDMEPFFAGYKRVLPYLINDEGVSDRERLQSPEEHERFDDTTKCILCAACTTACPVFWSDGRYFGPAAIVTLVFTNGCFDLMHVGHTRYLQAAKGLGDLLVVAVNSDASVRSLNKAPDRPIVSDSQRAEVVAALGCVDYVILFNEPDPQSLIAALQPDVLVKGGDWAVERIVGREIVEARGGVVRTIPLVPGVSTTSLIERIRSTST